jgi:hypothetical protein
MGGSIGIAENEGVPAPNPLLLPFARAARRPRSPSSAPGDRMNDVLRNYIYAGSSSGSPNWPKNVATLAGSRGSSG